jgi:hypothetical protein
MGAVSFELVPETSTIASIQEFIGMSIGFVSGLLLVNFLDYFVTMIEQSCSSCSSTPSFNSLNENSSLVDRVGVDTGILDYHSVGQTESKVMESQTNSLDSSIGSEENGNDLVLRLSAQAIAEPQQKEKISNKIHQLSDSVANVETKALLLHRCLQTGYNNAETETERIADEIDEEIHRFQYNLDHCRRYSL